MWILSKHARQTALAHAELESLIVHRTAELQNLSQRLLQVQDEERRKIARDLHDTTGQTGGAKNERFVPPGDLQTKLGGVSGCFGHCTTG